MAASLRRGNGGDNPQQIAKLTKRFLSPLGGKLGRYPKGRKGYNGRVERSHRHDDEEFYRPYLLQIANEQAFLAYSQHWTYFYNVLRPHFGAGMEKQSPLVRLQHLRYTGDPAIAIFPAILLDTISIDLFLACDPEGGNDVLVYYWSITVCAPFGGGPPTPRWRALII